MRETPTNVGTALQNAMRGIEVANQKHLYGVFGDSQWTNKDRLPDALLKDLIKHFSAISLGNQNVTTDIIGDGYEYLIEKFADATNKKADEFYTPRSVVRLLVDIVRKVRFPEWQATNAGERKVRKALRRTLFKYKLHQDSELFEKSYGYVKEYY